VLLLITDCILLSIFLKELVNLGLKEECNIDEIGSKFIQKSC
jgi:hypothetical protein